MKAFRCIHDSSLVQVSDAVALIGKNESGKTTLLEALAHLNKDYPIDDKDICDDLFDKVTPEDRIVTGYFELSEEEKTLIAQNFLELPAISEVIIFRRRGSSAVEYDFDAVKFPKRFSLIESAKPAFLTSLQNLQSVVASGVSKLFLEEPDATVQAEKRLAVHEQFTAAFQAITNSQPFEHKKVEGAFAKLAAEIQKYFKTIKPIQAELEAARKSLKGVFVVDDVQKSLTAFFIEKLHPKLIFFPEYKIIDGIVNVQEYLTNLEVPIKRSDTSYQFQKTETIKNLFHLAQFDPKNLASLAQNPTRLNSEQVRCSQRITNMLALTWKGKKIDVRLNMTAPTVTVEVADIYDDGTSKNKGLLDRRSAGFKWHFSFFVNFRAGIQQAAFKNAILLLDEPGVSLHPEQQNGMLDVIRELSETNQILYTTHSPFMIHNFDIGNLLTVEFDHETKASRIRTNFWEGDWQTIRPILHSIGDKLLLRVLDGSRVGTVMLIVEGTTDQDFLLALAANVAVDSEDKLGGSEPIPAGGHTQVRERSLHYQSRKHRVVAVFDKEPDALKEAEALKEQGFPADQIVTMDFGRKEADIEDVFTVEDYLKIVNAYYTPKLKHAKNFQAIKKEDLERVSGVNPEQRIVKSLEAIFASHHADGWGKFDKTGVCDFFCRELGEGRMKISTNTQERFDKIFKKICDAVNKSKQTPPQTSTSTSVQVA